MLQLRPYADERHAALQWVSLGSNAFNALEPFYARVTETPAYLADTTTQVTTDSFYWATASSPRSPTPPMPRACRTSSATRERLTSRAAALVLACDAEGGEAEACNAAIADECRRETDDLLARSSTRRA